MNADANPSHGKPMCAIAGEDRPGSRACRKFSRNAPSEIPPAHPTDTDLRGVLFDLRLVEGDSRYSIRSCRYSASVSDCSIFAMCSGPRVSIDRSIARSEEHTSEL